MEVTIAENIALRWRIEAGDRKGLSGGFGEELKERVKTTKIWVTWQHKDSDRVRWVQYLQQNGYLNGNRDAGYKINGIK